MLPVAVARFSSCNNAICCVLSVFWVTSCYGNYEFKRMLFGVHGASATAKLPLLVACSARYKSRGRQSPLSMITLLVLLEKLNAE